MPAQENNPTILPNTTAKPKKLYRKSEMAIKMVLAGIDPKTALQTVNCKDNISHQAISELKEKVRNHSLTEPSTVKLASSQVKRILRGKAREEAHRKTAKDGKVIEYTENVYPTDSNILAAASMVYDRYEPVQGAQESGAGQGNTYIDLSCVQVMVGSSSILPLTNNPDAQQDCKVLE